jgi:polyisoprenoid-binding protein YceI
MLWTPPWPEVNNDGMTESTPAGATSQLTDGTAAGHWVLDPAGSRAEFRIKHFWGIMTVRGLLEQMTGEAAVSPDGTVTGRISFEAASLNTKNKQRDKHLRSADFFDVEKHAQAVLTVTSAGPTGPAELRCQGTFEAAGHSRPVTFNAHLRDATAQSVVVDAELEVDRTEFGMTWSPLHMTAATAIGHVTARFTRA